VAVGVAPSSAATKPAPRKIQVTLMSHVGKMLVRVWSPNGKSSTLFTCINPVEQSVLESNGVLLHRYTRKCASTPTPRKVRVTHIMTAAAHPTPSDDRMTVQIWAGNGKAWLLWKCVPITVGSTYNRATGGSEWFRSTGNCHL
jgi:hypothetical protein